MGDTRIEGDRVILESGRNITLDDLGELADRLPWVTANVIIMPPHMYVVEMKLQSEEDHEAFRALQYACANHPSSWKAFFRAYKAKNKYLVIGNYRYWYTQVRAARMMNRCDRDSELENTRGGEGVRAIKKWNGCTYAWRREYGLQCENLHRYCNLLVVEATGRAEGFSITRYAAMVPREAYSAWHARHSTGVASAAEEGDIRRLLQGVEEFSKLLRANQNAPRTLQRR